MKIAIAGLRGNQANVIKKRFKDIEIVIVNSMTNKLMLPSSIDYFFYMTNFFNHQAEGQIKKFYPREKIVPVSHGLTNLRRKIKDYVEANVS